MIELQTVERVYGDGALGMRALQGVSLTVLSGEFVSIMGPSGSGKSTLLHLVSFLDTPTRGTYRFRGRDTATFSDAERAAIRNKEIGFVFQAFNLLGRMSVYENVELPLLYSSLHPEERRAAIEAAVLSVGLTEKLHLKANTLSGGEKQRVAIARALVCKPSIICADEPTGNLDSVSGAQVMEILRRLNEEGHTIILVTHETYTARYGRRLVTMKDGRIASDERVAGHASAGLSK
ncbi:MAG: putative ABC transport system ATP-binding protein [Parcubacteria group bacterium Gr01-1014_72]|nr:MAG: putative ABC transport system ATP-binding protein [Parcubacteria group bacterium Gr01-1014_72]